MILNGQNQKGHSRLKYSAWQKSNDSDPFVYYLKLTSNTLNSFSVDAEIRPSDTGGRSDMNNSLVSFLCWEIELHVINKSE